MNKQPHITQQTRQNLMDAFWSLYTQKRIEKITVREITLAAGYNRGTFYEYFRDVYDVLEQIENTLVPGVGELPPINLPAESIGMPLDDFLHLFKKNSQYYAALLGAGGDPAFAGKLKKTLKPMLKDIMLGKTKASELELDYILEFVLSAMIGVMGYWLEREQDLSGEAMMSLINGLMENGVVGRLI